MKTMQDIEAQISMIEMNMNLMQKRLDTLRIERKIMVDKLSEVEDITTPPQVIPSG